MHPSDFYLWGIHKDQVYENNPHTIEEFKDITTDIYKTSHQELHGVFRNISEYVPGNLMRPLT